MSEVKDESSCSLPGDDDDEDEHESNVAFFHVQPSSLSQGYEINFPIGDAPYQNNELTTKIRSAKCRVREYANWLDFKKPLDERRLCQAVSMNDTATVVHLLNQGVSASCFDNQRRSPLHLASCKGYAHIVRLLLDHGADPNARDSIGNTPLHLAACTNNIDVVMLLLKAGTYALSIDKLGRSPLDLAESKLRILQKSCVSDEEVKHQISQVIEMLLLFSREKVPEVRMDPELLGRAQARLRGAGSRQEVDEQLKGLLDSLGSLSLTQSAGHQ